MEGSAFVDLIIIECIYSNFFSLIIIVVLLFILLLTSVGKSKIFLTCSPSGDFIGFLIIPRT